MTRPMDYTAQTEEERARTFKRFCFHAKYWARYLSINHWQIHITHAHGPDEVEEESISSDQDFEGGVTTMEPSYERATVVLCTQDHTHWRDSLLKETALHELIHVLFSPLTELFSEEAVSTVAHRMIMESTVTHMTRAILGLYTSERV